MRDFAKEIEERKQAGLYRTRRLIAGPQQPTLTADGRSLLSFCSNDYLGLASHGENMRALEQALPVPPQFRAPLAEVRQALEVLEDPAHLYMLCLACAP